MAPRYPRPNRSQPIQAGIFQAQPLSLFIEVQEVPVQEELLPTLNPDEEVFLESLNTHW